MKTPPLAMLLCLTIWSHAQPSGTNAPMVTREHKFAMPPLGVGEDPSRADRFRVRVDLNLDARDDLLVSADRKTFSNGAGSFRVLLSTTNNTWTEVGEIRAHPKALYLEPATEWDGGRLVSYTRAKCCSGILSVHAISATTMTEISSRPIDPGPTGNEEDRALYEQYFSEAVRLHAEFSVSGGSGVVWRPDPP